MKRDNEADRLFEEYARLTHAMQSGVAAEMRFHAGPTSPKHLRVGVNSAMVQHAALVKLLTEKGLITELEFLTALRDGMRAEVERYEKHLSDKYGLTVNLA